MEKFDNMQQNKVTDEELDQITGGRGLFDIFTAEFRGKADKAVTLELDPDSKDNNFRVSTLEMRTNPMESQEEKKTKKIVKL